MLRNFDDLGRLIRFDHLDGECRRRSRHQLLGRVFVDLSVTAANVALVSGGVNKDNVAGEAFTAGQVVYLKTSNNKWMKAQCDGTAEEAGSGTVLGIALNTGVLNQPAAVQISGVINIGATVTVGEIYLLSDTAGGIVPEADITTSTERVLLIGIGATSANIDMNVKPLTYTGYAIP